MVQIANPIYDVVFKYLMNNEKVARLFLSAIIGKEVVALEFRPTEHHFPVGELPAVLRMDFSARIQDAEGNQELVIIEVQKAKMASDIMRFRRYLGEQYANKENLVREPSAEYPHRKALPILSIYFLGHKLEHAKAPVLRVNRVYVDAATGEQVHEKEKTISEKEKTISEKDDQMRRAVLNMHREGISTPKIAVFFGISEGEVLSLLQ